MRETHSRRKHGLPWSGAFQPFSKHGCGNSQHHDSEGKNPRDLRLLPVAGQRLVYSKELCQWNLENTEGIHLSDTEMYCQRRGRNQPSAVSWVSNRSLAIEKRH